jgi:glycosyltransferase involved in cell wall biosynthesis
LGVSQGVHIVTTGFAPRDAISQHVIQEQAFIRSLGYRCEIFAEPGMIDPKYRARAKSVRSWKSVAHKDDAAILHYSIASPAIDYVLDRAARCGLSYHNITPPEMLQEYAPHLAHECAIGRQRLAELADRVVGSIADSEYNASELTALGFPAPSVGGILLAPERVEISRHERPTHKTRPRLLFVGRGAPNKAQHDVILAVAALRETGVEADLLLVGSWGGIEAYQRHCEWIAHSTGVLNQVRFCGSVDDANLVRAYQTSDLFLCLSDHEGFCVPLVEAMAAGLPIVAYASSAVPGTVGEAALLLDEKPPSLVAEAILETLRNRSLQARMAEGRRERLAFHHPENVKQRLRGFVEGLVHR